MGSIIARKRKDGTTGYTAQIVIKRGGKRVHGEAQTFDREAAARLWMERREKVLASPGGLEHQTTVGVTLAQAIDKYTSSSTTAILSTKAQVLRTIKSYDIADMECERIRSKHIIDFASELAGKVQPQTVQNYLSHLSAVFAIARPAWGYELAIQEMRDAFTVAKRLGITAKSIRRERRPSLDELDRLLTHFQGVQQRRPGTNPMTKIVVFALFSTRRQEEIARITWGDYEADRVLVRDMKNPGQKVGNDIWCELVPEAQAVVTAMPADVPSRHDRIFPYSAVAISAAFTRACALLGIDDLHFHDLRHEGVTRLFEMGRTIPQVASVSGHKSWASLQHYTHMRQTGDKYAGWKWLPIVTGQPLSLLNTA